MEVYLVQHGEAKREEEDPTRPLTEKGRKEVEAIAKFLKKCGISVSRIFHSGKLRAKQTAEIIAQHVPPARSIGEADGLKPLDSPGKAKGLIESYGEEPIMLVGHLPNLSCLASLLVTGNSDEEVIKFRMGGVICLGKEDGKWLVRWAITPELALRV